MAQLYENIGHILILLVLLCFSAFFSGSETAYFSLSRRQIELLKKSSNKLQKLAGIVVGRERQLLSVLLLGNMTINVLFFAISSVLVLRIEKYSGVGAAAAAGAVSFSFLLIFGEIVPKALAYGHSKSISLAAAIPAYFFLTVLNPLTSAFRLFIVEPFMRLFLGRTKMPEPMSQQEFSLLMGQMKRRGFLTTQENRLLGEIVKLSTLRVKNCLRPRVDMVLCSIDIPNESFRELMQAHQLTKIPVYSGKVDNVVGYAELRDLLIHPDSKVKDIIRKVDFIPEQKSIESLLEHFRSTGTDTAVVVDEYGGLSGIVSLEDIAAQFFGPTQIGHNTLNPLSIGPFKYRLPANLPIHDWGPSLGIDTTEARYSTIAGLVTELLGRIPKTNEIVYLGNLKFTVEQIKDNRISSVILELEPFKAKK